MLGTAHILVVDDEPAFQMLLRLSLQKAGYTVQVAETGWAALDLYATADLVLLDIHLPDIDGFSVCLELRKRSYVPIVMLTALNRPDDIIHAFNVGADDYIIKPYRIDELVLRLQAVLRRSVWHASDAIYHILGTPDLLLNDTLYEVWVRGALVPVTPLEYRLLYYLMSHPNRPISKSDLCQIVWEDPSRTDPALVEVTVRRLREKIEVNPSRPSFLLTVRNVGYLFALPPLAVEANK